jgi:hypothetical protein
MPGADIVASQNLATPLNVMFLGTSETNNNKNIE